MPQFSGKSVRAQNELAVYNYPRPQTGPQSYYDKVVEISTAAVDFLSKSSGVCIVA